MKVGVIWVGCVHTSGGMKLWECALDLVHYLHTNPLSAGQKVLEVCCSSIEMVIMQLGCGAGLPGIAAALQACDVHFQDYVCMQNSHCIDID